MYAVYLMYYVYPVGFIACIIVRKRQEKDKPSHIITTLALSLLYDALTRNDIILSITNVALSAEIYSPYALLLGCTRLYDRY